MAQGLEVLTSVNLTRVAKTVEDQTLLPQPLMWYERAAKVQASDDEIVLRETSHVFAADIISADAPAQIRDSGGFTTETTKIAKVKHGFGLSESKMQLLDRIENAQASGADIIGFKSHVARNTDNLVLGVQQRIETMLIGMLLDGYTYDRLRIKVGGSWGMPQAFKVNPAIDWDSTSSTPITDILTLKVYALRTYGEVFNRITMSYTLLSYIVATTQFKEMFKALNFTWDVGNAAIETSDVSSYAPFVGRMLGMAVETYDGMYREHNSSGALNTPVRFLPENIALLTNSGDDRSGTGWDWAQGVIMESVVGRMGGTSVIGGFPATAFGTIAYACQADPGLNPPGLVVWAVDRGAPRKIRPTCSAKITAYDLP